MEARQQISSDSRSRFARLVRSTWAVQTNTVSAGPTLEPLPPDVSRAANFAAAEAARGLVHAGCEPPIYLGNWWNRKLMEHRPSDMPVTVPDDLWAQRTWLQNWIFVRAARPFVLLPVCDSNIGSCRRELMLQCILRKTVKYARNGKRSCRLVNKSCHAAWLKCRGLSSVTCSEAAAGLGQTQSLRRGVLNIRQSGIRRFFRRAMRGGTAALADAELTGFAT